MTQTLVAWHRLGKELGEGGFQVNPPDLVESYLKEKVSKFRATDESDWRWFKISEDLIVEKPFEGQFGCGPETLCYYLLDRNCFIHENVCFPALGKDWPWYIDIGVTEFRTDLDAWIFKDWFVDITVKDDLSTHSILDLDELAEARRIGLVNNDEMDQILRSAQNVVDLIRSGQFPPEEIRDRKELRAKLGL